MDMPEDDEEAPCCAVAAAAAAPALVAARLGASSDRIAAEVADCLTRAGKNIQSSYNGGTR